LQSLHVTVEETLKNIVTTLLRLRIWSWQAISHYKGWTTNDDDDGNDDANNNNNNNNNTLLPW